jgi:hypothetical protein
MLCSIVTYLDTNLVTEIEAEQRFDGLCFFVPEGVSLISIYPARYENADDCAETVGGGGAIFLLF